MLSTRSTNRMFYALLMLCALSSCQTHQDFGPAPDFLLQTVDGVELGLADFNPALQQRQDTPDAPDNTGDYLLINFWASWCNPCIEEMPLLNTAHANPEYRLQVIGIAADNAEPAQAMAARIGVDYPLLYGDVIDIQALMKHYGNDKGVLPYNALIDPHGTIIWHQAGMVNERLLDRFPIKAKQD